MGLRFANCGEENSPRRRSGFVQKSQAEGRASTGIAKAGGCAAAPGGGTGGGVKVYWAAIPKETPGTSNTGIGEPGAACDH